MINVMIADDHKIVRDGIGQILATTDDLSLQSEVADGPSALARLGESDCACNVLVLDLSMPGGGIDLIKQVHKLRPDLPVLVLSMHNEGVVVASALQAGARGYATKGCDAETLILAIRRVATGGEFIDAGIAGTVQVSGKSGSLPHTRLSEREREVFLRLANGETVSEIARDLNLSIKTVSTHKSNAMAKLGVSSTVELVRYALEHRLAAWEVS
jgi:two-component system, NarL family, invasion response regulator UvrY